jgi:hypothetical protein
LNEGCTEGKWAGVSQGEIDKKCKHQQDHARDEDERKGERHSREIMQGPGGRQRQEEMSQPRYQRTRTLKMGPKADRKNKRGRKTHRRNKTARPPVSSLGFSDKNVLSR